MPPSLNVVIGGGGHENKDESTYISFQKIVEQGYILYRFL
jgi:hypothetical protein